MPIYNLINPSDSYTFEAPDLTTAGVAAYLLNEAYGAQRIDVDEQERTPVFFGWDEWLKERGIDEPWIKAHATELADVFDSFLIGSYQERLDIADAMAMMSDEKREEFRAKRQDRRRTSMNKIGERAYNLAAFLRKKYKGAKPRSKVKK